MLLVHLNFDFSPAAHDIFFSSEWPLGLLWFGVEQNSVIALSISLYLSISLSTHKSPKTDSQTSTHHSNTHDKSFRNFSLVMK